MTLSDVEKIVGSKGVLINGKQIDGTIAATIPGELVYCWQNKDKSNMSVSLLNGRVTSAAENALN